MEKIIRIMTCGDVDNGKSTILGHLLYDNNLIYDDQKIKIKDNQYAHILDGLSVEQEQNITVDVAYRFFTINDIKFILSDCPGHVQYTKNMATGASVSDICLLVIDVERGFTEQSKHHINICSFMGITNFVVLINKMDKVEYSSDLFNSLATEIYHYTQYNKLKIDRLQFIPISGLCGENLDHISSTMPWYIGKDLLSTLLSFDVKLKEQHSGNILLVQRVTHKNNNRYVEGYLSEGLLNIDDNIQILPSKQKASIKEIILNTEHNLSLVTNEDVDISSGDVIITDNTDNVIVGNDCISDILLFEPIWKNRDYIFKTENNKILCNFKSDLNEINVVNSGIELLLQQSMPLSITNFNLSRFIIIDIKSHNVVGYGKVKQINEKQESLSKVIWFTGLSGSGKSTLAKAIQTRFSEYNFIILDGDELRNGVNNDLDFSLDSRIENIRRTAFLTKLLTNQGKSVIISCITPTEECRALAKSIVGDNFREVYLSTSFDVCQKRDVKGLYKNTPKNFTGVDSTFEIPTFADLELDTEALDVETCLLKIQSILR